MNIFRLLAAMLPPLTLAGCLADGPLKWDEDVLLPDGRVVTVHRVQQWLKGEEGNPGDYSIEFKDPDTQQAIRWEHDRHLTTMVLFKHEGSVYLLLKPLWGSSMGNYNCPNPPYFLRKHQSQTWVEVPLQDIPIKKLKVNMTDNLFDQHKQIQAQSYKFYVANTQSRKVQTNKPPYVAPYVMDFSEVRKQTFGLQNCGREDLLYADQIR